MEREIRGLASAQDILVLATSADDRPHTSLMSYACEDDARTFYLLTRRDSAKWANIVQNPNVSLLIDSRTLENPEDQEGALALTVAGRAEEIREPEEREHARSLLLLGHPHLQEFAEHPQVVVFKVKAASFLLLDGVAAARFCPA